MQKLSVSEQYAVAAVIALLMLVALDNAIVLFAGSLVGLAVGLLLVWRGLLTPPRAAMVAIVAFAISAAFALYALLR